MAEPVSDGKQTETKAEEGKKTEQTTKSGDEWKNVDEVKQIIAQRDDFKTRYKSMESEHNTLKSRLQELEQAEAARNQKSEQDKLEAQGKYQEAVELTKKKYSEQFGQFQSRVVSKLVPAAIAAAAAELENVAPEAIKDIPSLVGQKIRLNLETLEPEVIGDDGKVVVDPETLKPVTIKDFVSKYISERPYLLLDRTVGNSGLKPGQKGAPGGGWDMAKALADPKYAKAWKDADLEGYNKAAKAHFNNMKDLARAKMGIK